MIERPTCPFGRAPTVGAAWSFLVAAEGNAPSEIALDPDHDRLLGATANLINVRLGPLCGLRTVHRPRSEEGDSSSWNGVVDLLLKDGYDVRALPNTLRGLEADAAVVSTYLKTVSGPVVLVGHSYGGSVISVASANAPNVRALVYVDAFVPEAGESIQEELASAPPPPADFTIAVPFTTPTGGDADLYVNAKYFGVVFASAEPPEIAARLAATQRPFAARCLTDKAPAAIGWKTIPSWYVMGDADKVIPPDIQKKFATRMKSKVYHVPGGDHPSMIAHPEVTVAAIEDAANTIAH